MITRMLRKMDEVTTYENSVRVHEAGLGEA